MNTRRLAAPVTLLLMPPKDIFFISYLVCFEEARLLLFLAET